MKMKERNSQLKNTLGNIPNVERIKESASVPKYDTTNRQGHGAYALPDELRLISMLNTLKIEPQYYRSENEILVELRDLIEALAFNEPYFVAQCIVYSRCLGEGMRTINHLAAALFAPFASSTSWGKWFYSLWNKREKRGGCIYRPDDMSEILEAFHALNESKLTNPMKKGFAYALENLDAYSLSKYSKTTIDIANLVHPNPNKCKGLTTIDGKTVNVLDALMKGETVSADTWEVAQSSAGQEVAEAVKAGKLTKEKAKEVLAEAKNENWKNLLEENKLGILAAVRNLRNMLKEPEADVIDLVCKLVSNGEAIKKGKIMPYQLDLAWEAVKTEFNSSYSRDVLTALETGLELAGPNLKEILRGSSCVIVDMSGSMKWAQLRDTRTGFKYKSSCADKAALIAAMIAKATNADIIRFGSHAEYFNYSPQGSIFELAHEINSVNLGGTSLSSAFTLIAHDKRKYDRIFILSDDECNIGNQAAAYKDLIRQVNSPYIYSVDLASYGTTPLKNSNKVNYYYGYGYAMFDDIASKEFDPQMHIDKIRKVVIGPFDRDLVV